MQDYIGITGFTSREEVDRAQQAYVRYVPVTQYLLGVGVVTDYEVLHGLPEHRLGAFVPRREIATLLGRGDTFNCIHYLDPRGRWPLWHGIASAIELGGPELHAVQLDLPWPDSREIEQGLLRSAGRGVDITLQIAQSAIEVAGGRPADIVERLAPYEGLVQRVLLDKALEGSRTMDVRFLDDLIQAICRRFPTLGIVVAGGLGPDTLNALHVLLAARSGLSWDAQVRLHRGHEADAPLNMDGVVAYLERSAKLVW